MCDPLTPPAAFFWSTANLTPFAVDWPPVVHTGRSDPILIVPFDPVLPPPPPHANVTTAANVRITSPLPRTIWFSLCLLEAVADAPSHSPPSSQPESGRECAGRRMSATWRGRTTTHCGTIDLYLPRSQAVLQIPLPRVWLVWKRGCINRGVLRCNLWP